MALRERGVVVVVLDTAKLLVCVCDDEEIPLLCILLLDLKEMCKCAKIKFIELWYDNLYNILFPRIGLFKYVK